MINDLASFITQMMIRFDVMYRHPDIDTGYSWRQMQALVIYHGNLAVTLAVLSRN
jgi:hypothetical protein